MPPEYGTIHTQHQNLAEEWQSSHLILKKNINGHNHRQIYNIL